MITIDMSNMVVAVTGADRGIGAGIAARFAAAGSSLVLHHRRSDAPPTTDRSASVQLDLTAAGGADRLIEIAVERFGRLDAVVNNAGIQPVREFGEISAEDWDEMLATNVSAAHWITQSFVRHVRDRGGDGAVVHVASIEGHQPALGHSHYAISKAALIMHAKAAALEVGRFGVRVNSVSPGLIDRDGLERDWPEGVDRFRKAAPLARLGTPSDIGDACVFLCSPMAAWITGVDLIVDGGVSSGPSW
ncbi:MAG: SDR family oxidoreductase [Ilumatobacteraceae bacterium]